MTVALAMSAKEVDTFNKKHADKWYSQYYGVNSGNCIYVHDVSGCRVALRTYYNHFEMFRSPTYGVRGPGVAVAEEMRGDRTWVEVLWVDELVIGQPLRFVVLHDYELEAQEFTLLAIRSKNT